MPHESKHTYASSSHGTHARMHKAAYTSKVKIDVHRPGEKRFSPLFIPQPNPNFRKAKQVWVTMKNLEKITISTKLEVLSASSK
ncbi:unnamed protein product, partial [Ilex paraguariensis]